MIHVVTNPDAEVSMDGDVFKRACDAVDADGLAKPKTYNYHGAQLDSQKRWGFSLQNMGYKFITYKHDGDLGANVNCGKCLLAASAIIDQPRIVANSFYLLIAGSYCHK